MNLSSSARCLLGLLALQLASACGSSNLPPSNTGDTTAPTSRATPAGGTYSGGITVSLLCDDAGGSGCAGTYYTLDGSEPSRASPAFKDAIALSANTTLKFFSVDKAGNAESVHTEQYTFGPGNTGGDTRAPTVAASPKGGTYASPVEVTLTCDDAGGSGCAAIHYTLDGSAPTAASPVYTPPLLVSASGTLRFFALDAAGNASAAGSESYFIDTAGPTTTATPAGGTYAHTFSVTLACDDGVGGSGCKATYYTLDGSLPTASSARYTGPIAVTASTTLKFFSVDNAGHEGPRGSEQYTLDFDAPVTTASPKAGNYASAQAVTLTCADGTGTGCKATYYTTDGSAPSQGSPRYTGTPLSITADTVLRFFSTDNAGNSEPVQVLSYVIDTLPPTTTATPAGKAYNGAQDVTLACVDAGSGCKATYFTTDGSAPTTASPRHTAGDVIHVTASGTLKFFSQDAVGNTEAARTETYVIDTSAPLVTATPAGGTFRAAQSVTLACNDGAGTGCGPIYFTTDGSTPTAASSTYSTPLALSATTTLKFFAKDAVGNSSGVKTETYVIDTVAPTASASPKGGLYNTAQSVTLACVDPGGGGCKVHYTVDGSDPTTASPTAASLTVSSTQTLKFLAEDTAGNVSGIYTESYELDTTPPTVAANPSGRMTNRALTVTLSCSDGARGCKDIRYTTDGSVPTSGSSLYSAPLVVTGNATLKFVGTDLAGNTSPVGSETYTFDTVAPITTASPAGGSYSGPTQVTLSCSDALAGCQDTFYTTDGTLPTTASARYTGAFTLGVTTTLKFFSTDKAGNAEAVHTEVYQLPINGAAISQQLANVRTAADGAAALPIDKALVTYVKPLVGSATSDPAGFFLQGEKQGPALFVVDPGGLSPAPQPGDRVSLVVTQKGTSNGQPRALTFSGYTVHSHGEAVGPLVQDVSNVDVPANLEAYDSTLITLAGTIANTFVTGGTGHVQVALTTAGVPATSPSASLYRLRVVATVQDGLDLANGCTLALTAPLWRFNTTAQPSIWAAQDAQVLSCPAPRVTSALALSSTTLAVRFDRRISAASVLANGSQFTFSNGLSATSATVVDREVRLTTTAQAGGLDYTVTVAPSVKDTYGSALDSTAVSATFKGYQQPALLRINEVAPNIAIGRDVIELYVVQGGSTANETVWLDGSTSALATLPAVSVATGDLIVIHLNPDKTTGTVDAPDSEKTSKSQYPAATYTSNYDNAWDFHGGASGINYAGNWVLRVKDAFGNTQDGVAFARVVATNPPAAYLPQLQALQAEGLWKPADCAGALCTYNTYPSAVDVSANWGVNALPSDRSTTVYRIGNADTDQGTDWTVGPSSLGASNP